MTIHKLSILLLTLSATAQGLTPNTLTLASSANPSIFGAPVTLTATVTPSSATGRVTFYDGVTVLGTRPLSGGAATFLTRLLASGPRKLRAYYAGDSGNPAATSNVITQTVNAQPSIYLTTAPTPWVSTQMVVGDFNGDGIADLATANNGSIVILLGRGSVVFQPMAMNPSLFGFPVAAADFNGDGKADLLVQDQDSFTGSLYVLPGNGDGTFQAGIRVAPAVRSPVVSDFNGDGKPDLALSTADGVIILLGKAETFANPLPQPLSSSVELFQPGVLYPSGALAGGGVLASGDFNGDGKADLAAGSQSTVSILLGRGDGSFQPPLTDAALTQANSSIVVADLNSDGKADLVTLSFRNKISIQLGNGDGTFQSPVTVYPAPIAESVTVGDFNGDGKTDLAVGNVPIVTFDTASILLGNGDGTVQTPISYPMSGARSLMAVEFSGDGKTDLLGLATLFVGTTMSLTATGGTPQSAPVGAAFPIQLQATLLDGSSPVSGATVEFVSGLSPTTGASAALSSRTTITDASGVARLSVTANQFLGSYLVLALSQGLSTTFSLTNTAGPPATLTVLSGTPQSAVPGAAFPNALRAKLTDSAGNPITGATVNFTVPPSGPTAVLSSGMALTDPSGIASVTATAGVTTGSYTVTASFGLLSATFSLSNALQSAVTLTASPNPSIFGAPVTLTATVTPSSATGRVAFYDGVTMLGTSQLAGGAAAFSTSLLPAGSRKLKAYYAGDPGNPTGTSNVVTQTVNAQPSSSFTQGTSLPYFIGSVVADFNGDGKADIAIGREAIPFSVVLGNGDGTFRTTFTGPVDPGLPIAAADFNGDGKADLLVQGSYSNNKLSILLGNGDGTFQSPLDLGAPSINYSVAVGDYNGDGKADIAIADSITGSVSILPGNGNGTFQPAIASPTGFPSNIGFTVGDFNGDGKADLIVIGFATSTMKILQGNGDGTFQAPVNVTLLALPGRPVVGDFNKDGNADLAIAHANSPLVSILLGRGDGTFQPPVTYPSGTNFGSVNVGDFNGDGSLDLAIDYSGTLSTLKGNGDGTFQAPILIYQRNEPTFVHAVGEFNGDGKTDLLTSVSILLGGGGILNVTATGGTPQSTPIGMAFPTQLQVTVRDGVNPVSGVAVTFAAPVTGSGTSGVPAPTGPSAILSSTTALTNALGIASITATANNTQGNYFVTASVGALSASFSLTNVLGVVVSPNLSLGKPAAQSSTLSGFAPAGAASAVDGSTDGNFFNASVTHTNLENSPWWQVDLGTSAAVNSIVIWNRTDCCGSRLSDYWVFVSDTPFSLTDTPSTLQNRVGTWSSHQTTAPNPSITIPAGGAIGRYVRVQLTGADSLSLAEVQVTGTAGSSSGPSGTNVALHKPATQSITLAGYATAGAASAVDGLTDGNFFNGSVTHTDFSSSPWWQVDLGASTAINSILIWNRTDCCSARLNDYWVFVSDTPFGPSDTPSTLQNRAGTFSSHQTSAPGPFTTIPAITQGRYVRVQLAGANYLSLAEVQVIGQ